MVPKFEQYFIHPKLQIDVARQRIFHLNMRFRMYSNSIVIQILAAMQALHRTCTSHSFMSVSRGNSPSYNPGQKSLVHVHLAYTVG